MFIFVIYKVEISVYNIDALYLHDLSNSNSKLQLLYTTEFIIIL